MRVTGSTPSYTQPPPPPPPRPPPPAPPPPPPATTNPGTVSDLAVADVTDSSVTLSFTEVSNGAGLPASYFVRFAKPPIAWGSATDVTWGSCKVPMAGTVIGANRTSAYSVSRPRPPMSSS